jgi:phosphoribosyl-AMP cyclohydrolase
MQGSVMTTSLQDHEHACAGTRLPFSLDQLQWNDAGLLPVITQDAQTGQVLMLAWVNHEALQETLATQKVCYWSRSRKKLWRKGESSGHQQRLVRLQVDCDADTILLQVHQQGAGLSYLQTPLFFLAS